MATAAQVLKLRRGTAAENAAFTGANAEVTVDTDNRRLVVHDGVTAGGNPVITRDGQAASTGAGGVGVIGTATGEVATFVAPMLNLMVKGLKRNFGATGDGTADDLTKIQNALTATGKIIEIEDGTFRFSANLPTPTCSQIIGFGEDVSILKPGASVTKALSIGHASTPVRLLRDFKLDGSLTTGACTGILLGDAASWAGKLERVRVFSFDVSGSYGLRLGDALKTIIEQCTLYGNHINLLSERVGSGAFPTTVTFLGGVIANAVTTGALYKDGFSVVHHGTDFESNGEHAVKILIPSGRTIADLVFDNGCWFEDNWLSLVADNPTRITKYALEAGDGTSLGGGTIRPAIKNVFFDSNGTNRPKAIRMNGSAVAGFTIADVQPGSATGTISVENSAYGSIDLPANLSYATVVSDTLGNAYSTKQHQRDEEAAWTTYTPIYGSDGRDEDATFSGAVTTSRARYKVVGKTLHLSLAGSGTLEAVTPAYISVSIPAGLTLQSNLDLGATLVTNGTAGTGAWRTDGGSSIWFFSSVASAGFSSGAAVAWKLVTTLELA